MAWWLVRWSNSFKLSEGRWFEDGLVSSLLCCFLRQETLLHIVFLHPGVKTGTSDILQGITLQWSSILPIQG